MTSNHDANIHNVIAYELVPRIIMNLKRVQLICFTNVLNYIYYVPFILNCSNCRVHLKLNAEQQK